MLKKATSTIEDIGIHTRIEKAERDAKNQVDNVLKGNPRLAKLIDVARQLDAEYERWAKISDGLDRDPAMPDRDIWEECLPIGDHPRTEAWTIWASETGYSAIGWLNERLIEIQHPLWDKIVECPCRTVAEMHAKIQILLEVDSPDPTEELLQTFLPVPDPDPTNSKLVDAVASAMYACWPVKKGRPDLWPSWQDQVKLGVDGRAGLYREYAKAAIGAMREAPPSEAKTDA